MQLPPEILIVVWDLDSFVQRHSRVTRLNFGRFDDNLLVRQECDNTKVPREFHDVESLWRIVDDLFLCDIYIESYLCKEFGIDEWNEGECVKVVFLHSVEWSGEEEMKKKGNINKRILYGTRVLFVFGFRAAVSGRWSCLLAALTGDIPWMNNSTTHALASLISLACLGGWCALLRCSGPIMRDRSLSFSLIRALLRFPSC